MHRRFDALTSLRFVAAFLVLLGHVCPRWAPAALAATVAVPFFFTLSGFVLFHAGGASPTGRFYWRRFTKIAPLFYVSLALHAVVCAAYLDPFGLALPRSRLAAAAAVNAAFLGAWFPRWLILNFPGWTLSAEAFFYLLFPFLAPLVSRLPRRLLLPAFTLNFLAAATLHAAIGGAGSFLDFVFTNPLAHLDEFVCGLLLARLWREGPGSLPPWLPFTAGAIGVAALAAFVAPLAETAARSYAGTPLFCLLIWGAAGLRGGWLTARVSVALGEASYALYVLHVPLLDLARFTLQPRLPPALYVALMLALLPLASLAAHRFVERPAREWLLRKEPRPGAG